MFKGLIILSLLMNLSIAGLLGWFYAARGDDAQFIMDFVRKPEAQRQVIRDSQKTVDSVPNLVQSEFQSLLVDEELRKAFAEHGIPASIQELLVRATRTAMANENARLAAMNAATERHAMTSREYGDITSRLRAQSEELRVRTEAHERERKEWEELRTNEFLNQLVFDIDKADDEYGGLAKRLTGLPVGYQAYVLRSVKDSEARTTLESLLTTDEQAALKSYYSRNQAAPAGSVGSTTTAAR